MKKFLAALLVVVMVVSMIPATVFAASSCPVEKAFGTHSKAYCDLKGVKYEQFGEAVEGKCGQDGYTMYKCKCGAYFADDIVDMPDHAHAVGAKPVVARVEPTCTKEGQAAMYICINCNEQYAEYKEGDVKSTDKDAPAGALAMVDHKWGSPSGASTDCTATVVKCTVCGKVNEEHKPTNKEHDFDYNNPTAIKKDPTNCEPGIATFKCKNCKVTKDVAVDVTGHTKATTKKVAAVVGACDTVGVKEHYVCEKCGAKFLEQKDGSLKLATDADLATAIGHSYASTPNYKVLETCTTYGIEYYFCINCGEPTTKNYKEPLGHTTYAEAVAHDAKVTKAADKWITKVTATNCTDQTTYTWKCQEKCYCNGTSAKATCNVVMTHKEPAKGHTYEYINVPATVTLPVSYTITVCTDAKCTTPHVVSTTFTDGGVTYTLPSEVKVEGGNVYEMTANDKSGYRAIEISNAVKVDVEKCGAHYYELDDNAINKVPTCTTKGYDVYFCHACNSKVILSVDALGHNFDLNKGATVEGTWDCDGAVNVLCSRYSECGEKQAHPYGLGHKFSTTLLKEVKDANCDPTFGSKGKYYKCQYCEAVKITGEVKYEYTPYFDSLTAAQKAHGNNLTATANVVVGDCVKKGHIEYFCSKCKLAVWVFDETTGKHLPPQGVTPVKKEDADCVTAAGMPQYTCARPGCGVVVPAENVAPGHDMTEHPAVPSTCDKAGNYLYYTCSRSCCTEKVNNKTQPIKYMKVDTGVKDEYGDPIYTYVAYAKDAWIDPADGHNKVQTVVAPNCTTKGYTHEICTNGCGFEHVFDVIQPLGHVEGTKIVKNPTCTVAGSETIPCTRPDCDKKGVAKKTTIPALGHMNAAGEIITSRCDDTVTDRVCLACNKVTNGCSDCKDIELNEKTKKYEVKKLHKEVDKDFAATCTTPAYTLTTCEYGCGEINKVEYKGKANGHKFAWGEKVGLDYVDAKILADKTEEFLLNPANGISAYTPATNKTSGSVTFKCADCKATITMEVKKVGVGITMTMDNAVVPGANYKYNAGGDIIDISPVDGDVLAFYIDINAFETDVWGFNFDFVYNAKALNFLGYDFCADDVFGSYMVNNVVTDEKVYEDVNNDGVKELIKLTKGAEGTVKISAYTENGIDGTMTDAKITGVNRFITLFFQVEALYEVTDKGVATVEKAEDIVVEVKNISITNTKGEVAGYGNKLGTKIDTMMDTNDNGNFNITDVQNCVKIIKGEADYEYLPACDVNKDGVVNLTDLDLMNKYLVGSVDAFEIYKALSWKTPEGFVAA